MRSTGSGRAAVAIAVVAAAVLSACGGAASTGGGPAAGPRADGAFDCPDGGITIGMVKAASGAASGFDLPGEHGAQMLFDDVNAKGGIEGCRIEVIKGDSQSNPAVAAQVASQLLGQGADILVVADDFDLGISAAQFGVQDGKLTLSGATSSTQFAPAVGENFFSGGIPTDSLGAARAQFALDNGWRETFQVYDSAFAFFTEQNKVFAQRYTAGGGRIGAIDESKSFATSADFSATISKIKTQQPPPDVIQMMLLYPAAGTFVKQLRAAGIDTPVISDQALAQRDFPRQAGAAGVQNVFYASQVYFEGAGYDTDVDPVIAELTSRYEKTYGVFPTSGNMVVNYAFFAVVVDAIRRAGTVDAAAVSAQLKATTNLAVPGATLERFQDGHGVWSVPIITYREDGRFKRAKVYTSAELAG